jgi:hypothetical protein
LWGIISFIQKGCEIPCDILNELISKYLWRINDPKAPIADIYEILHNVLFSNFPSKDGLMGVGCLGYMSFLPCGSSVSCAGSPIAFRILLKSGDEPVVLGEIISRSLTVHDDDYRNSTRNVDQLRQQVLTVAISGIHPNEPLRDVTFPLRNQQVLDVTYSHLMGIIQLNQKGDHIAWTLTPKGWLQVTSSEISFGDPKEFLGTSAHRELLLIYGNC